MVNLELLAPAGDFEKLKTALYFGADAVYVGGKAFSLRALAGNFTNEELEMATKYTHSKNKKIYVTVNIFAKNADIESATEYFKFLQEIKVDGVIISDPGLIYVCKTVAPNLSINLSTQANTLNYKSAEFWKNMGVTRVILARELSFEEIKKIHTENEGLEIETFIHGAMCISYSGRCLLSDYRAGRQSNRGACVQACRWEYSVKEKGASEYMDVEEDERGTYIFNSKDLCLVDYIDELVSSGVISFKIEGRMKSEYYLATVINAYRRAIDKYIEVGKAYREDKLFMEELKKTAHRDFTTAYTLGENDKTVNYEDSQSKGTFNFIAKVVDKKEDHYIVEMRNRFAIGDELEVLSPSKSFNKIVKVGKMLDDFGKVVEDAKIVQQKLHFYTDVDLSVGDILRRKA